PASGRAQTVAELPGYTRDLALFDRFAFVGLSRIRETSTFGGMPIAERRPELKCGVGVVDLGSGRLVAHLEFVTGVEEIFDVQVGPGGAGGPLPGAARAVRQPGRHRADLDGAAACARPRAIVKPCSTGVCCDPPMNGERSDEDFILASLVPFAWQRQADPPGFAHPT